MKIALVGSSGYLAQALFQRLAHTHTIVAIGRQQQGSQYLELTQAEAFDYELLADVQVVLFSAAISSPDECGKKQARSRRINVTGTRYFIRKALEKNCRILFFSSDAVFGEDRINIETSPTIATTPYGAMKKEIEDTFHKERAFKAIRLSYVVSANDRFLAYCLRCQHEHIPIEVYHPMYRNCVCMHEVLHDVVWLLTHWDDYLPTFFHVAGKELVSRIRIVEELNRLGKHPIEYRIVQPEPAFYAYRAKCIQMESMYRQAYQIRSETSFSTALRKEMEGVWK